MFSRGSANTPHTKNIQYFITFYPWFGPPPLKKKYLDLCGFLDVYLFSPAACLLWRFLCWAGKISLYEPMQWLFTGIYWRLVRDRATQTYWPAKQINELESQIQLQTGGNSPPSVVTSRMVLMNLYILSDFFLRKNQTNQHLSLLISP